MPGNSLNEAQRWMLSRDGLSATRWLVRCLRGPLAMRKILLTTTIAAWIFAAANKADAGSIFTYQYTGQPFHFFSAGVETSRFTSSNQVTFAFTTSAPIALDAGYTMVDLSGAPNPTLLSWSISDGTNTFSSSTVTFSQSAISAEGLLHLSEVETDASGNIVSWFFGAEQFGGKYPIPNGPADQVGITIESCGSAPCISSLGHAAEYAGEFDLINSPDGGNYLYSGGASSPGTWTETVSPVSEPGTLAILGGGLPGLLTARRCWASGAVR